MSASQSAVRSRAEAVKASRTFDWLITFTVFFCCTWWLSHSLYVDWR